MAHGCEVKEEDGTLQCQSMLGPEKIDPEWRKTVKGKTKSDAKLTPIKQLISQQITSFLKYILLCQINPN